MTGLLIEISLPDLCVDSIVEGVCLSVLCVDPRTNWIYYIYVFYYCQQLTFGSTIERDFF